VNTPVQIVLPIYNGLPYLSEAISSVFSQTIPHWRLILVDDGSTDGSREALKCYADPRVRVVFNSCNYGLYGSLARIVRLLPSAWVAIVMQDDRLKPNYLENMLALAAKKTDCAAFWAAIDEIDAAGDLINGGLNTGQLMTIEPGTEAWIDALRRGCFWIISGSFTHSDLLRELPFKENYPHCGDYDWLLRVLLHARMVYYEQPLTEIRIHSGSAGAGNLAQGTDVPEGYAIVRDNCRTHASRLSRMEVFDICRKRATPIVRRAVSALWRGKPDVAVRLLGCSLQFGLLPLIYSLGAKTVGSKHSLTNLT
jgi:glycosyltransferase involved in cell wall biosynthesis